MTNDKRAIPALFIVYFLSGFTALLYQVVWQRMLGLFSGSDVRSVTIVVASYLLGLGVGGWLGGWIGDRLSNRQAVQIYSCCNFGIAIFAVCSRFLFYDLLFLQGKSLAQSPAMMLAIVFVSLLIPTTLMGVSLPLVTKATSRHAEGAAARIGLLYGLNTLGSGLGTLVSGWYIIGTFGYEKTVYFGAILSAVVGIIAWSISHQFYSNRPVLTISNTANGALRSRSLWQWCFLVFLSGFVAISLEIIWFRVLDTVLQSIAYTYAHLLAFILVGNALGSIAGSATIRFIRQPRKVFFVIQAGIAAYALISIWLISIYWQSYPTDLRTDIGYIDLNNITSIVILRYVVIPSVMLVLPNFLLGFYFPLVQKAVQTKDSQIGQRVGFIQVANILGNSTGSLLTGLVLLDKFGTAGSLRFIAWLGLGFALLCFNLRRDKLTSMLAIALAVIIAVFPNNTRLWAALHGIPATQYFLAAEDSTGVAAVTEVNGQGTLLASGQAQASFPYMQVHALLGSLPALIHPHPAQVIIIGLGSGGTAHTAGVNPATRQIKVVELLKAELTVLRQYAQTPNGQPLKYLFEDPRYKFIVGDGRQELELSQQQFDIIEADAIYPWRSRAGMLYSQEFFQAVRSHLAPGGMFVEWNVGLGTAQTFRSVFPFVMQLSMSGDLHVLIGSDRPVDFNRQRLLNKLEDASVLNFLAKASVNVEAIRQDVKTAQVNLYSHAKDGQPQPVNTDLFPRSEYYLNQG
ncbi:fused MFS/spermidine synthase [Chroococcidiopsis sp. FACHB-1243]|uniref:fused MFS/spermidine synthase n=1 Tax=Chroococcidiopsis sp. [FACHB-1243] TaxID=2692781 RepID=UPI0017805263|nr:fused MFS/spermidine synthase [Chroococcidiopsis sp. [FACHB-1243]]MBD2309446.1 fused MFS/spermidine synthase [Chroococcidiopsis sp. [FACHB-1243]]